MSELSVHELQERRSDRITNDELYNVLDEAYGDVLWAPPTDMSEFEAEIEGHIEQARKHLEHAMKLRRAEISGVIITELQGEES